MSDNFIGKQYLPQVNRSRYHRSFFNITGLEDVVAELLLTMWQVLNMTPANCDYQVIMTCIAVAGVQIQCKGMYPTKNLMRYGTGLVYCLCQGNGPYAHPLPIPERIPSIFSIIFAQACHATTQIGFPSRIIVDQSRWYLFDRELNLADNHGNGITLDSIPPLVIENLHRSL